MSQNTFSLDISQHALKRLDMILGVEKARRETRFMHQFLLPGCYTITWNLGMNLQDISEFAQRCESFNIIFLGCETHLDGPSPLYVYCMEDFLELGPEWYLQAITELKSHKILDHIIPTIDVPEMILKKYLL